MASHRVVYIILDYLKTWVSFRIETGSSKVAVH